MSDSNIYTVGASRPLVSIGVPVYNGEEFLGEALESVLRQDYENCEIIISDNASTDGTEAICRRFARTDSRIRYFRHDTNIGLTANFDAARKYATGKYFQWLAHDDLLSNPKCLSVIVDYLEGHPDVVLCGSSFHLLRNQANGGAVPTTFPTIHPDVPWRKARLEFFRWPQQAEYHVIYGMFRRDALARVPIVGRTHKQKPVVCDMEYPIITAIAGRGRVVALPEFLRTYRERTFSAGSVAVRAFSPFDHLVMSTRMKMTILRNAWKMRIPLGEKLELIGLALKNFTVENFCCRLDIRRINAEKQARIDILQRAAEERQQVIHSLQSEIERRQQLLSDLQQRASAA